MVKMSSLAIILLLVAAIAGWGFWIGLSVSSGAEIASLEIENQALRSQRDSLNASYTALSTDYTRLVAEHSKLQADYGALNTDYVSLQADYARLNGTYQSLAADLQSGKALAESATWLSEDERLKVTSEVTPDYLGTYLWGWYIKVTVTNVGSEPLDTVWIMVFPYVQGKLEFSTYSDATSVTDLYMGESYSYTFTVSPSTTTYSVLAVGG
jgi:hypothetical protein